MNSRIRVEGGGKMDMTFFFSTVSNCMDVFANYQGAKNQSKEDSST